MNEAEEWKPILGFEGYYEVSNYGRVKRLERYKESNWGNGTVKHIYPEKTILQDNGTGYSRVTLQFNKNKKRYLVHRLVAIHFLKYNEERNYVNHIDGNKLNNNVKNLEWVNAKENTEHAYKAGLMGWRSKKLNKSDVICIRESKEKLIILSKKYNLSTRQIYAIKKKECYKNI